MTGYWLFGGPRHHPDGLWTAHPPAVRLLLRVAWCRIKLGLFGEDQRGKREGKTGGRTHKLYTQSSPLVAQREHDGLAPLHLTCRDLTSQLGNLGRHPRGSARTLRLRQASHEKALFLGSVGLGSAIPVGRTEASLHGRRKRKVERG